MRQRGVGKGEEEGEIQGGRAVREGGGVVRGSDGVKWSIIRQEPVVPRRHGLSPSPPPPAKSVFTPASRGLVQPGCENPSGYVNTAGAGAGT